MINRVVDKINTKSIDTINLFHSKIPKESELLLNLGLTLHNQKWMEENDSKQNGSILIYLNHNNEDISDVVYHLKDGSFR